MEHFDRVYEEMKVRAADLVERVKGLIHEGNVRRVIIKDEHGNTFIEVPLTVATVGAILAPVLAAVGAIATVLSHFTVVVERTQDRDTPSQSHATTSGMGATEGQVDMKGTVPPRVDSKGTKVEDIGGTGEVDTKGG